MRSAGFIFATYFVRKGGRMHKILVVEDDESIKRELTALLSSNGYAVVEAPPCDLALLDVNLPDVSGFDLCRRLRTENRCPVIFLTARDSAEDEIVGFASGADDYIRKPYNSSVLLMRIARLLDSSKSSVLSANGLCLDLADMTVEFGGARAELTKNETRILACLIKNGLCTKERLLEELWNDSLYIDENTLYVNIGRLREKLKGLGAAGAIRTVRGVGYRL